MTILLIDVNFRFVDMISSSCAILNLLHFFGSETESVNIALVGKNQVTEPNKTNNAAIALC